MGRVGRVLAFARRVVRGTANTSDVTFDRGGGDLRTGQHFGPPGDDSQPLPGDYVAEVPQGPTGRDSAVGYADVVSAPASGPGEVRRYARDPATGDTVSEVWQKSDGQILLANAAGFIHLLADGSVNINGVLFAPNGDTTVPNSLNLAGKELAGHDHPAGDPPGNTGPNN